MAHADNGVHGGTDFVAHIGQKIALCFGGFFAIALAFWSSSSFFLSSVIPGNAFHPLERLDFSLSSSQFPLFFHIKNRPFLPWKSSISAT
jgi:hypothetical protein